MGGVGGDREDLHTVFEGGPVIIKGQPPSSGDWGDDDVGKLIKNVTDLFGHMTPSHRIPRKHQI